MLQTTTAVLSLGLALVSIRMFYYLQSCPAAENNEEAVLLLRQQLKKALHEKIEAIEENIKLAKLCKDSEEKYINLLFKIQELHAALKNKSLMLKEYMEENQNLKEEIALLKKLFVNG